MMEVETSASAADVETTPLALGKAARIRQNPDGRLPTNIPSQSWDRQKKKLWLTKRLFAKKRYQLCQYERFFQEDWVGGCHLIRAERDNACVYAMSKEGGEIAFYEACLKDAQAQTSAPQRMEQLMADLRSAEEELAEIAAEDPELAEALRQSLPQPPANPADLPMQIKRQKRVGRVYAADRSFQMARAPHQRHILHAVTCSGVFCSFNVETETKIISFDLSPETHWEAVDFVPNDPNLIVSCGEHYALSDIRVGETVATLPLPKGVMSQECVSCHPSGRYWASSGQQEDHVVFVDMRALRGGKHAGASSASSENSYVSQVLVKSDGSHRNEFDPATRSYRRAFTGHSPDDQVFCVVFDRQGDRFFTKGQDGMYAWDANLGSGIAKLADSGGNYLFVEKPFLLPDGQTLLSGCGFNSMKLWNIRDPPGSQEALRHREWQPLLSLQPYEEGIVRHIDALDDLSWLLVQTSACNVLYTQFGQ